MEALELSIVIAAHDASAVIDTCLEALAPQREAHRIEVIVCDSSSDDTPRRIAERFPWVDLSHDAARPGLAALRGRGIARARGAVIALLDPFSVAAPDWVDRVVDAHARISHPVIGGAVGLYRAERCNLSAWTLYLNEYALFMPPVDGGAASIVPGANVSYKRAALFDGETPRFPVFWKTFANWEIENGGTPLWLEPGIRVDLYKPIPFGDFLRTRYDHGRCFAGLRVQRAGPARRLLRAVSTPAVPPLLLWRWARGFWRKRQRRARFLATLPGQTLLFAVWAWGEARGYLGGPGGCCERIRY